MYRTVVIAGRKLGSGIHWCVADWSVGWI